MKTKTSIFILFVLVVSAINVGVLSSEKNSEFFLELLPKLAFADSESGGSGSEDPVWMRVDYLQSSESSYFDIQCAPPKVKHCITTTNIYLRSCYYIGQGGVSCSPGEITIPTTICGDCV